MGRTSYSPLDRWMLSRLNASVQAATVAMERLRVREVVNIVLYHLENDAAWYQRRLGPKKVKGDSRNHVLRQVFDLKARILAPRAPHVAEEMWAELGNKGLVAKAEWPKPNDKLVDRIAEASESVINDTLEDTSEILKATGKRPARASAWCARPRNGRCPRKRQTPPAKPEPSEPTSFATTMRTPSVRV